MGLGQEEELLHRLADAAAEQAARPERDLPLDGLEAAASPACAHGSRNDVSRARRYGALDRVEDDEHEADAGDHREVADRHAGGDEHRRDREGDHQRSAEVRLRRDQEARGADHQADRHQLLGLSDDLRPLRDDAGARRARARASAISDGWNCSGPAPSQRRAPLTETPMPGSFTARGGRTKTPAAAP